MMGRKRRGFSCPRAPASSILSPRSLLQFLALGGRRTEFFESFDLRGFRALSYMRLIYTPFGPPSLSGAPPCGPAPTARPHTSLGQRPRTGAGERSQG
jgi:hypothetical protein